jgi:hypothetical protein
MAQILQGHDDHDYVETVGRVLGISDRDEFILSVSSSVIRGKLKGSGTTYWIPVGTIQSVEVLGYPELQT